MTSLVIRVRRTHQYAQSAQRVLRTRDTGPSECAVGRSVGPLACRCRRQRYSTHLDEGKTRPNQPVRGCEGFASRGEHGPRYVVQQTAPVFFTSHNGRLYSGLGYFQTHSRRGGQYLYVLWIFDRRNNPIHRPSLLSSAPSVPLRTTSLYFSSVYMYKAAKTPILFHSRP